jgi:hypothetical protein
MNFPNWITGCVFIVAWIWVVTTVGVEWSFNLGFEQRRILEAKYIVEHVCNTVLGASLAREFAKCEEAQIILMDESIVWKKAFIKTIETVCRVAFEKAGTVSIQMVCNGGLLILSLGALGVLAKAITYALTEADERDVLSPIAQHRLLETNFIDMSNIDTKKIV